MRKSLMLAFAAYVVPTFILGFVWHLVAFHEVYLRLGIYRAEPIIPLGLGSMLVQAAVFAWIYPRAFDTARDAWMPSALRAGATFALLSWSFTTLAVGAKHPMTSLRDYLLIESAFTVAQFMLVAPLMALAWRAPAARN
jgi:hypothetical protein